MKTQEVQFGGNNYPCRVVESNEGEELLIGSTTLLDALPFSPVVSTMKTKASQARKPKESITRFSSLPIGQTYDLQT